MNDTRTTNILLIALIVLLALFLFKPALDGASNVQAYDGDSANVTSSADTAQADATRAIADANRDIAKAVEGLGEKIAEAADKIATAISSKPEPGAPPAAE